MLGLSLLGEIIPKDPFYSLFPRSHREVWVDFYQLCEDTIWEEIGEFVEA